MCNISLIFYAKNRYLTIPTIELSYALSDTWLILGKVTSRVFDLKLGAEYVYKGICISQIKWQQKMFASHCMRPVKILWAFVVTSLHRMNFG